MTLFTLYIIISFTIFYLISKISYYLNLVDLPNKRKVHFIPTAYTGGIAISFSYIFSIYLFNVDSNKLNLILSFGSLIAIIGFIDDKYSLNIGGKLSLQIIPVIYLIVLENFQLNHIGDYNYFKLELNSFSIPFTLLCVMFLINSFNYFDGLDGTLGISSISVFLILYFLIPDHNIRLYLSILILTGFIFLFFNFSLLKLPKLFSGDSGSMLIGFVTAFTLIYIANKNLIHPILLGFSISIFVFEFLSINLIRLIDKKNIFTAGLDHLHHIFLKKSKSLFLTNLFISAINFIFFIIGYYTFKFNNSILSLTMFILLFVFYFIVRKKYFHNK